LYIVLVVKTEGKCPLGDLGVDWCIILGWICGERWCIGSCWRNWGIRDNWGDLGVDGWIILEWV